VKASERPIGTRKAGLTSKGFAVLESISSRHIDVDIGDRESSLGANRGKIEVRIMELEKGEREWVSAYLVGADREALYGRVQHLQILEHARVRDLDELGLKEAERRTKRSVNDRREKTEAGKDADLCDSVVRTLANSVEKRSAECLARLPSISDLTRTIAGGNRTYEGIPAESTPKNTVDQFLIEKKRQRKDSLFSTLTVEGVPSASEAAIAKRKRRLAVRPKLARSAR
jgi:hypothetical protein